MDALLLEEMEMNFSATVNIRFIKALYKNKCKKKGLAIVVLKSTYT